MTEQRHAGIVVILGSESTCLKGHIVSRSCDYPVIPTYSLGCSADELGTYLQRLILLVL